jgi:hypothetical protein
VLGDARVTRRRLRWIAVQAIVVTALAVVVVLTLLKPESQSPLSGISGDDSPTIAQGPGSGPGDNPENDGGDRNDDKPDGRDDRPGDGDRGGNDNATSPPTGTASASAGGSPPVAPIAPQTSPVRPDGGFETPSPTEDQYDDTLGALESALR